MAIKTILILEGSNSRMEDKVVLDKVSMPNEQSDRNLIHTNFTMFLAHQESQEGQPNPPDDC